MLSLTLYYVRTFLIFFVNETPPLSFHYITAYSFCTHWYLILWSMQPPLEQEKIQLSFFACQSLNWLLCGELYAKYTKEGSQYWGLSAHRESCSIHQIYTI